MIIFTKQSILFRRLLVLTPSMEAFGESLGFFVLEREEEFSGPIRLLDSHMLDVNLFFEKKKNQEVSSAIKNLSFLT